VARDRHAPEHDRPPVGIFLDEGETGVEPCVHTLLEVLDAHDSLGHRQLEALAGATDAGQVDALFGAEMVVDDRARDAGGLGDAFYGRSVVSVFGEQDFCDVEELLDARRSRHAATWWFGRSTRWHQSSSRQVLPNTQNPHDQDLDGYATVGYGCATYK
jgi:hypothetical protein